MFVNFVLHETKVTFSYQDAVEKLEGRNALRTSLAFDTLVPLADQLGREGTGLESLEVVVHEGLRTALTLLITVPGVLEADGRAVERSRQAAGHT